MNRAIYCALFFCSAAVSSAQLRPEQKVADFLQLAGLYAKNYGPYEWKRDALRVDALETRPWLERVAQTKDDLDFYEICVEYVASLNDAHDVFTLPSDFYAWMGFDVDLYDGKALVEYIDRSIRPSRSYQFQVGDEVVSVDGKTVEEWIHDLTRYAVSANPRSTRRVAAGLITYRPQGLMPHAPDVGERAIVLFRRQNGNLEYYEIPWQKYGVPLSQAGPVPSPFTSRMTRRSMLHRQGSGQEESPAYMRPLERLQNIALPAERYAVMGVGAFEPVFAMPYDFEQRLGLAPADNFFSGTFAAGDYQIGFIRIPRMTPYTTTTAAIRQFENEMLYLQSHTDGLVIDVMRNPGGSVSFTEELLRRLIPYKFRTIGFEIRATSNWVASISSALDAAKAASADKWVIDLYGVLLRDVQQANREYRGRTGPEPLGSSSIDLLPASDRTGAMLVYTKPVLVLTDEFSASGGDFFPAVIQDNQRGLLFGMRTMGAGGSVVDFDAGVYSEGSTRVTLSLMHRKNPVVTSDYPTSFYVENIGVRPDVEVDYMTKDNLLNDGQAFVEAFSSAIVDLIRKTPQ